MLAFVILFRFGKVFADLTGRRVLQIRPRLHGPAPSASANFFGWSGTLAGAAIGAWVVLRLGTLRALFLTGALQALSLGLYLDAADHRPQRSRR